MHSFRCTVMVLMATTILLGMQQVNAQSFEDKLEKDQRVEIKVGDIPPDFTLVDLDGNTFTLSEMAGEMPVVLDFWATWCGPCIMEIPLLNEFAQEYEGEVILVGITSEGEDSEETIRNFMVEQELVYPIIHDPSRETMTSYGVRGIPHLVIIDTSGVVVGIHVGFSETVIDEVKADLGF